MAARQSYFAWLGLCIGLATISLATGCGGAGSSPNPTPTPTPTPTPSTTNQWTWVRGAEADDPTPYGWAGPGSEPYNSDPWYGTQGTPIPYNGKGAGTVPGGRNSSASWTDKSGNLWLFGGQGLDANVNDSFLNDLWEYTASTNEWTWVGGSNTGGTNYDGLYVVYGQSGIYGTKGTAAPSNVPGGRELPLSFTDSAGNFWLFGGVGFDSTGVVGFLNDLLEFNPTSKKWTWMSGSSIVGSNPAAQMGIYGTQGTPSAANVPPGLQKAIGWIDKNNNIWIFGGNGPDLNGGLYALDNLWEFTPSTGEWTWVNGPGDVAGGGTVGAGVYGSLGVPAQGNIPGARFSSTSWIDTSGNLWLFGGFGSGAIGPDGQVGQNVLNDLWKFDPTTELWTWMAGAAGGTYNGPGDLFPPTAVYGTQGVAASGNTPGGREDSAGWTDSEGNFWLFGGDGLDSTGYFGYGPLNDLWKFNVAANEWTWVSGSDLSSQGGTYGVEGTPASANIPGGRYNSAAWVDPSGDFWIFAGWGLITPANGGSTTLNDLWRYHP